AEVAMHDSEGLALRVRALVDVGQSVRERDGDGHCVGPRDLQLELDRAGSNLSEVSPLDVLDDDVGVAFLVLRRLQDLGDARMLELRLDASFVQEARQKGAVASVISANDLQHARTLGPFDPASRSQ